MSEVKELPDRVLREEIAPKQVGYVEEHEVAEAKKMINDIFVGLTGKPFGFRTAGFYLATKIHIRSDEIKTVDTPEGKKTIYLPPVVTEDDKYQSCVALVCGMGPQAYKGRNPDGTERFPEGPWCREGDLIVVPRHESFLISYRGVAMAVIPDDRVVGVVESPDDIRRVQESYRN